MAYEENIEQQASAPEPEQHEQPVVIVGIAVCALSLSSLERIFSEVGVGLGASYLVAVRQQEGLDAAAVYEMLRRQGRLAVTVAADGERILPNHIYIGGSDDMMTLEDGHIRIRAASEPVGHRGTVDTMLISLAEHAQERAIAVILRGLENDGTAGVAATKKFGGLSIAEIGENEEGSAEEGLGASAIADLRLPAQGIATHIALYAGNVTEEEDIGLEDEPPSGLEAQITQIATVLRNVTSHDFHGYKRGTFTRRVQRRMQVLQIGSIETYIERLRASRDEVQNLFQDLLIGVTQFFRDPGEFEALEREIPRLFEGKEPGDQLRVWVLGCATGEEAYSIAMLLREHMATMDYPPDVQIFATDLDARALGIARAGRYSAAITSQVQPERLARWFVREGDTFCVVKELREMCIFSPHNIVKDAPFSRIDILSCRNLLIYLDSELQNRVIPIFHFALRPSGILFLGSSENVTRHGKLFAPVDRKNRLFRRLETATRIIPDFPLSPRPRNPDNPLAAPAPTLQTGRLSATISRQAEVVAERFAPAYVVVDSHYDVLHFSGRTGRYLEPASGTATLNLLSLAHRDLRLDMRSALQRATTEAIKVEVPRVLLRQDDRTYAVNIIVEPLGSGDVTSLIVLFQDAGQVAEGVAPDGGRLTSEEHVQRLETDLRVTRDRLQATIEELESTNEELKSSNEEYQSINEELQSANEEMETSKEELQSVNEELQTVNGELAHRVTELDRTNSDLKNLLEATQIATVFLDNDLRVRSFTPAATEIFHLLDTDVGRPLDHVVSRVAYPELLDDVRLVLRTLVPVDRKVSDFTDKRHYAARALPYRSVDNYISGAVVTFTDLTATYEAEVALRRSEERLQRVLETDAVGVIFLNQDGVIFDANEVFLKMSGYTRSQMERAELHWRRLTPPEHLAESAAQMEALKETGKIGPYEKEYFLADGSRRWMLFAGRDLGDGTVAEFCIDISARKQAQAALRQGEEQFRLFGEASSDVLWIRDAETLQWVYLTPAFETIYGVDREQAMTGNNFRSWAELIIPEDREQALSEIGRVRNGERVEFEYRIRRASDHEIRWLRNADFPLFGEEGNVKQIGGIGRDITEEKASAERMKVLVAELQHRTRNLMAVVRSMADKTMRTSTSLEDFHERFRDRLDVLARVQGLLSRLQEGDRITFDQLIRSELEAHGMPDGANGKISLQGPEGVRLRSTTVQTMALAMHELGTNAAKYGALGQPQAHLSISWRVEQPGEGGKPWLHVDWLESRVKMPPAESGPQGGGQGRELIERALPYQLDAKTSYVLGEDGVRCTIAIPVSLSNVIEDEGDD
ncbi:MULTISPECIES: CheR family methyltransferase [Rhizobium]|uniref:Blue-light-activated histidine kinase n=1 Tax=Rhizobium phaseoli TaxID=396 RepID=A0A7X6F147_9HYPH|nr:MULTISPECIES: CheR family methyltransferase [Rhizobium]ANL37531.1 protein-glutamate methyltransferase CheR-type protein [Rhizobium phaseoli]ANL50200.1 protein-glutamate methyltransferase CheR-type protein [Rhizobium phaseoli]ANM01242.1 protein-glutamate methyltransferase CheR-type protein [Rhizobium phaseoli]MDE8757779.1 PAS domain S-box protein [Rhizobium sp. CBK13]NKF11535.1 PAS domain S-box protein [Rhizobium phaseoli]